MRYGIHMFRARERFRLPLRPLGGEGRGEVGRTTGKSLELGRELPRVRRPPAHPTLSDPRDGAGRQAAGWASAHRRKRQPRAGPGQFGTSPTSFADGHARKVYWGWPISTLVSQSTANGRSLKRTFNTVWCRLLRAHSSHFQALAACLNADDEHDARFNISKPPLGRAPGPIIGRYGKAALTPPCGQRLQLRKPVD